LFREYDVVCLAALAEEVLDALAVGPPDDETLLLDLAEVTS
jgi:hypothetical protein